MKYFLEAFLYFYRYVCFPEYIYKRGFLLGVLFSSFQIGFHIVTTGWLDF